MGRVCFSRVERESIWSLWREGRSLSDIARATGRKVGTVHAFLSSQGGIAPRRTVASAHALSTGERETISRGLAAHESFRSIARCASHASPRPVLHERRRRGVLLRRRPRRQSASRLPFGFAHHLAPRLRYANARVARRCALAQPMPPNVVRPASADPRQCQKSHISTWVLQGSRSRWLPTRRSPSRRSLRRMTAATASEWRLIQSAACPITTPRPLSMDRQSRFVSASTSAMFPAWARSGRRTMMSRFRHFRPARTNSPPLGGMMWGFPILRYRSS